MNFGAKFSTDIQIQQWLRMDHTPGAGNWITVITERSIWTHFDGLMTRPDLLPTFYDFLSYQKSKIHLFKNLNKNVNTYILEQWWPVASGHNRPTRGASPGFECHASLYLSASAVELVVHVFHATSIVVGFCRQVNDLDVVVARWWSLHSEQQRKWLVNGYNIINVVRTASQSVVVS